MADFSNVTIVGRLTRDVEMKDVGSAKVSKFGLAFSKGFGDNKKTVFVDITIWGKQAEFANTYFKKGSECIVRGELDFDTWQSKEGEKKTKLYVTADRIQFCGGKKENNDSAAVAETKAGDEEPSF